MIDTPQIVQTPRQRTAAIHVTIPRSSIQQVFPTAVDELMAELGKQGVAPAGALLSYHLKMPSDVFDFEIAFPVEQDVKPGGRVVASEVPAMKVARTVYHGPMEGLGAAWGELAQWIKANGHALGEQMFERYLVSPGDTKDVSKWETELNWPLAD
ncbi:MAG: transcriptional activator ligand binding domain protein [Massilia sp.]|nr:transcriptional activator ligand binding domain protein [Massilia sp.]